MPKRIQARPVPRRAGFVGFHVAVYDARSSHAPAPVPPRATAAHLPPEGAFPGRGSVGPAFCPLDVRHTEPRRRFIQAKTGNDVGVEEPATWRASSRSAGAARESQPQRDSSLMATMRSRTAPPEEHHAMPPLPGRAPARSDPLSARSSVRCGSTVLSIVADVAAERKPRETRQTAMLRGHSVLPVV